jgi:chloramphenicol-sensitive protein RarD
MALAIAACAVAVITVDYGRLPWLALVPAFAFGSYALLKKQANAPAMEALTFESSVIGPFALGYLLFLMAAGGSHFISSGPGHTALFMLSGVVTAVPLALFGAAAIRIPMIMLGLIQYLSPILQFIVGVAIQHEEMTQARWVGFGIVWLALAVFTLEALLQSRLRAGVARQVV